jgi:uncharacterized membrane protein
MSPRAVILVPLALCGLLLNLLLLYWKLADTSGNIVGCNGGGCDAVLGSRWGQVLGVPVSAAGALAYLVMFGALLWDRRGIAAACYASVLGAMLWFVFVQAMLLGHFCPWCMAAHGLGLVVGICGLLTTPWDRFVSRGFQAGVFGSLSLALIQVYGPAPAGYQIETQAIAPGREISFTGGHRSYEATALPRLGPVDAPHVMVEYFDYRCPACRTMCGYLDALLRKHPKQIAVLLLPVPLEHACNSAMPPAEEGHPGSCAIARIALAVWRVKPDAFAGFHRALLAEPLPDEAMALEMAHAIVPSADLEEAIKDPWIESTLRSHVVDWSVLSNQTRKLPKLIIRDKRILHGLPSGEADFIRVLEQELGL